MSINFSEKKIKKNSEGNGHPRIRLYRGLGYMI